MDTAYDNRTLTAFFDTRDDAQEAADRLRALGINDGSINLIGDQTQGSATRPDATEDKGFWDSLSDFFFPDDDRAAYAEGLRRGGFLLTVRDVPSGMYDQALDILDDEGSIDVDQRAESWRSEGWSGGYGASSSAIGSDMAASGTGSSALLESGSGARSDFASDEAYRTSSVAADSRTDTLDATARTGREDEEVIPVLEEQLRVGKRDVNLGRVRVRSYVVEEPVQEQVNLRQERVFVERRPVDRELTGTEAAFTDRVIEAEEHAEEAVISKTARVKEEIALRREADERTETVSDTVRHTEVEVEDDRMTDDQLGRERRASDKI